MLCVVCFAFVAPPRRFVTVGRIDSRVVSCVQRNGDVDLTLHGSTQWAPRGMETHLPESEKVVNQLDRSNAVKDASATVRSAYGSYGVK